MSEQRATTSLRLLILTLNLLNTDLGLTASALVERVPGYESPEPDSAMRKFERDLATLRETGLDVETLQHCSPPRYRIPRSRYQVGDLLSDGEFQLLSRAASSWTDVAATQGGVVANKLRAVSSLDSTPTAPSTNLSLEGGAYTPALHAAILHSQPVSFYYQSRTGLEEREVAPWNLIARGNALYLWGFDLNRWDARLFRLSRFRSVPVLIAEKEATVPTGVLTPREFDYNSFLIEPLLAVRRDSAPLVRMRASVVDTPDGWALPKGWECLRGRR
ncbi:MAG: WYL domain-containing protein, partial [Scrofimicrobium sp.]